MGVGLYSRGMDRDFLEYILIEIFSCPECLYTFDRSGFLASSVNGESPLPEVEQLPEKDWKPVFFSVNTRLQDTMAKTTPDRLEILSKASRDGHGLFAIHEADPAIPRLPQDSLIACELAQICAKTILSGQQKGEEQARLNQKISGFYLKQYYIHGILAKNAAGAALAREQQAQGQRCSRRSPQSIRSTTSNSTCWKNVCTARPAAFSSPICSAPPPPTRNSRKLWPPSANGRSAR